MPNGGTLTENFEYTLSFNSNSVDLEIDSILLKQGILALTVENDFEHNVLLEVRLPTFKDQNGNSLVLNYNLPPAPSSSGTSVRASKVDISTYTLNFTEDANGNSAVNKFPIFIKATFNLTPNKGSNSNDELRIIGSLRNLNFKTFSGYIGQIELELDEDSIGIDLFKNFRTGVFFLTNPFLDITVNNSFGIPTDITFQKIVGYNPTESPSEINVIFPIDPLTGQRNVRRLNAPTSFGSEKTIIELNSTNSNVADVVSFLPKAIIYDTKTNFNVNGKTSDRNFFSDTSQIGLDVFLRLPFEGYVSDFVLLDTIDFKFVNSDDIEKGLIRLIAENGFPVEAELQIIFVDFLYQPIDSLYAVGEEFIIPSSITNSDGETIENRIQVTDTKISKERIKALTEANYAIIIAKLQSDNAPNKTVRFYEDYRLGINLGLKATISIN